jgi:hypothetical protein
MLVADLPLSAVAASFFGYGPGGPGGDPKDGLDQLPGRWLLLTPWFKAKGRAKFGPLELSRKCVGCADDFTSAAIPDTSGAS